VGLIASSAPSRPLFTAAVIGLNPVALWALAEGHNDALAFAIAASGVMLASKNPRAGGIRPRIRLPTAASRSEPRSQSRPPC
jgi:hypothetical protein